jgi:hypothetical protein
VSYGDMAANTIQISNVGQNYVFEGGKDSIREGREQSRKINWLAWIGCDAVSRSCKLSESSLMAHVINPS